MMTNEVLGKIAIVKKEGHNPRGGRVTGKMEGPILLVEDSRSFFSLPIPMEECEIVDERRKGKDDRRVKSGKRDRRER